MIILSKAFLTILYLKGMWALELVLSILQVMKSNSILTILYYEKCHLNEMRLKQITIFKSKTAQQSVHLTGAILRHFRALSKPEQNPALGVLSTPAHPQVTQTVRRVGYGFKERV